MRFGFFDQLPCPNGFSERQRYRDFIAQIELGDALGFDTAWLGEIHFSRAFSILADPLMVLAAAAQRTTRIRLGTAVTLLPLHNPIRIVEEAATADILSDGRLEFGVGRGVAYQYPGYGIPLEESRERFEEALDFIVQAWTNEPFSFKGKYFRAQDLSIVPKPLQSPHPPVRVAANSPDTFPFSGRRKLPIFASPLINPPDKLKAGLAIYRDTLAGTPGDTALAFPVHVTASRAQARQDCEAGLMRFTRGRRARAPQGSVRLQELRGFSPGPRPLRTGQVRGLRPRHRGIRRSGLLRRAGAGASARIWVRRVHLLLQPRWNDGPCDGQTIDDGVRSRGDATLPIVLGHMNFQSCPSRTAQLIPEHTNADRILRYRYWADG